MTLQIEDRAHYDAVTKFATEVGALDKLTAQLDYLGTYGGTPTYTLCRLFRDFAPHSFTFQISRNGEWWLNGGLIYSGPGVPLDGSGPAFTVSLNDSGQEHNWSVHT